MQTQTIASCTLKDSVRAYPGCKIKFSLTSKETSHALAVLEMNMIPGSEPPRHYHEWEDETLIIKTGAVVFFIGDDIINAEAGTLVYIPRKTPHHFVVISEKASCDLILTPGGLEDFFALITFPYSEQNIPEAATVPPSKEEMETMNMHADQYGIRFI